MNREIPTIYQFIATLRTMGWPESLTWHEWNVLYWEEYRKDMEIS